MNKKPIKTKKKRYAFSLLVFFSATFFMLFFNAIISGWVEYFNASDYRKGVFTVQSVHISEWSGAQKNNQPQYAYAKGTIGNVSFTYTLIQENIFTLDLDELRSLVPAGTQFSVLYDTTLKHIIVGGVSVGVIKYAEEHFSKLLQTNIRFTVIAILPLCFCLVLKLLQRRKQRVQESLQQSDPGS